MTQEVRLSRIDRRQAILNTFPAPRVRVRVTPFVTRATHTEPAPATQPDEVDDLRAARGILWAVLLSIGLWALIGLVIWLIAR